MTQSLAVIPPDQRALVEQYTATDPQTGRALIQVTTPEQEADAVNGLAFVQGLRRALEKGYKEQRAPLKADLDKLDASWKGVINQVETGEKNVKAAILHWRNAEATRIRAEQDRIERENAERLRKAAEAEEAEKKRVADAAAEEARAAGFTEPEAQEYAASEVKDAPPVPAPPMEVLPMAPVATVRASMGSATASKVWNYRITNPDQVPHAYRDCVPSAGKIRTAMNSGLRELPGVEFFEEDRLSGRRAS